MSHAVNLHDGTGTIVSIPGFGIIQAAGVTVPADGSEGYAPSCVFQDINSGAVYVNEGTKSSSDFNAVTVAG